MVPSKSPLITSDTSAYPSTVAAASANDNFDHQQLDVVTSGSPPYLKDHLLTRITHVNCKIIIAYVMAFMTEVNPSTNYRQHTIQKLKNLAEFHNPKSFKDLSRDDVIAYMDRLRKSEIADPLHKWVGSYENDRIVLLRFFKWLYGSDIPHKYRPTPDVVNNIPRIKRKETSTYKPSDLWTEEDDLLFLKYCSSKRDRAYHMVARDTGCRPHELLGAKIKDLTWVNTDSYQVGKLMVNGKTGQGELPITRSVPYLKDWLANGHPWPTVLNAPIFCGDGKKNTGKRLAKNSINTIYRVYQYRRFPKLLDDPMVPPEDKIKIRALLQGKRWNPYVRRHTALTEISRKVSTPVLNQYARWSPGSKMAAKYLHYFGNEAFDDILASQGIKTAADPASGKKYDILKPKVCSNCSESNKPDAKICAHCKYVLTYDAYLEKEKEREESKNKMEELKKYLQDQDKEIEAIEKSMLKTKRGWQEAKEKEDRLNKKRDKLMKEILLRYHEKDNKKGKQN